MCWLLKNSCVWVNRWWDLCWTRCLRRWVVVWWWGSWSWWWYFFVFFVWGFILIWSFICCFLSFLGIVCGLILTTGTALSSDVRFIRICLEGCLFYLRAAIWRFEACARRCLTCRRLLFGLRAFSRPYYRKYGSFSIFVCRVKREFVWGCPCC